MQEFLAITKALSDENRVRALSALLAGGELCLCQIIELLGLAPSTVSRHMAILHEASLVNSRKDGRWMYYRAADGTAPGRARAALAMVERCLAGDQRIHQDARQLRRIRRTGREKLCTCYHC